MLLVAFLLVNAQNRHLSLVVASSVVQGDAVNCNTCKRRSSVSSGAWLRRFDEHNRSGKTLRCKSKTRKNIVSLQLNMLFPQTWNAWKFAMFKDFVHS